MQWAREREEMAKLEQYHSQLASKYERNTISNNRTQLITNTEVVNQKNNFHQKNFNVRRIRSPSLPPIDKTMTRQGSNNSDQSSGYLSGGGGGDGSNSLPPNANNTIDTQPNYDYNYSQTRFDSLDEKFHPNQGHQQHQIQKQQKSLKKLSLTSSLNDYSSSTTNEQEMEYNNSH
ncbi:CLUMA_CG012149, isoform A, partial [Clunio marinus]